MSRCLHWGLLCLLVPLVLGLVGNGARAAGDLFDSAYKDCPHRTRLRDGPIADLTVARDADEEKEVNVSWAATDPATWGLGPNTYRTSLVVILDDDDGDPVARTLSLGTRNVTFDKVKTARKVTVQLAIVVDTADGAYLISDILEKSIHQSLTAPSFSTGWRRVKSLGNKAEDKKKFFVIDSEPVTAGAMYYIGYNENFANYRAGDNTARKAITTIPATPRLRIGLAHGGENDENDKAREAVDFDAYILRIADADGDVVSEGNDVATVKSDYGIGEDDHDNDEQVNPPPDNPTPRLKVDNKLFVYDVYYGLRFSNRDTLRPIIIQNGSPSTGPDSGIALNNVRIVDGADISVPMHLANEAIFRIPLVTGNRRVWPGDSIIKVGVGGSATRDAVDIVVGNVYANPPDEYRDFPIDTLSSDERYTITAWAVNDDHEVISPVATLTVRPVNETVKLGGGAQGFSDYLNLHNRGGPGVTDGTLVVTEFTVLK